MKDIFSTWPLALRYIFKDPVNFFLFIIPATISVFLYAIVGFYFMSGALDWARALISDYIVSQNASMFLYYLVTGLLMFLFYLLVSWTFIMVIGVIAAPFNDVISRRIEHKMRGGSPSEDKSKTIKEVFSGLLKTVLNELKKIVVILIVTVAAALLNFIPLLYPVALFLIALLMSAQYLDYTWSRHDLPAGQCMKDLVRAPIVNGFSGFMFLILMAIPFINALVPGLATSYYTVLWNKRQNPQLTNA